MNYTHTEHNGQLAFSDKRYTFLSIPSRLEGFKEILINTSSMVPIYEQIMENVRKMIVTGELKAGDPLPSVRTLAKEQRISALTVKKAYDRLEEEGLAVTVHGKGTYITGADSSRLEEEQRREVEAAMEQAVTKARNYGISDDDLRDLLELLLEAE